MNAQNEQQWPEYLMLRDTGLSDDAGGLGQRIYTTAGASYEKQKYIRADLASQPSPVVKQNLTTQPAAAQEAAYKVRRGIGEPWKECDRAAFDVVTASRPADARKLYAAPVTAAPAGVTRDDAEQVIDRIMGEYGFSMPSRAYAELVDEFMCAPAAPSDATALIQDLRAAVSLGRPLQHSDVDEIERALASTPAAPGIDQAIAAVESIQQYMRDDFQALPPEVFSLPQKAQRALVTLRGLADAPMRVHPRDAKEAVDYVVAHMLADSPKGGSDARDAARWRAVDAAGSGVTLRLHSARPGERAEVIDAVMQAQTDEAPTYTTGHCENHKKPGGCPLHNLQCGYPRCDRRQAGDAEVEP